MVIDVVIEQAEGTVLQFLVSSFCSGYIYSTTLHLRGQHFANENLDKSKRSNMNIALWNLNKEHNNLQPWNMNHIYYYNFCHYSFYKSS